MENICFNILNLVLRIFTYYIYFLWAILYFFTRNRLYNVLTNVAETLQFSKVNFPLQNALHVFNRVEFGRRIQSLHQMCFFENLKDYYYSLVSFTEWRIVIQENHLLSEKYMTSSPMDPRVPSEPCLSMLTS